MFSLASNHCSPPMLAIGSGLGSAGFAVYEDSARAVRIAETYPRFLYVESCAQCPPCKLHSGDISQDLARIDAGKGDGATIQEILFRCSMVTDGQRCGLPDGVDAIVPGLTAYFGDEFDAHLNGRGSATTREIEVPRITGYTAGTGFTFDERQALKRPDWTYEG
jgi:NADH-quinone oxidoreductase subunit F